VSETSRSRFATRDWNEPDAAGPCDVLRIFPADLGFPPAATGDRSRSVGAVPESAAPNLHAKCRIASGANKFYHAGVKHSGKALLAALKMVGWSGAAVVVLLAAAFLGKVIGAFVLNYLVWVLISLWALFAGFAFYFFRDPDRVIPPGPVAVSPADGKVIAIKPDGPGLTRPPFQIRRKIVG